MVRKKKTLVRQPDSPSKWPRWTGFRGKTAWDWMDLLIVPLALVVIGLLFSMLQDTRQQALENQRQEQALVIENRRAEAERELAEQQAQDEALQAYLDQMTSLLLEKNLRESEKGSEVRILAQARTATVIQALDADGNRNVIRFLQEARLTGDINGETPSAFSLLRRTDLQGARLEDADLDGIDLAYTILDDAHLRGTAPEWLPSASLARADMSRTYLEDCNLVGATLENAILRDAYLYGANLSSATLEDADLSRANIGGGAVVREAHLTSANLTRTNLSYADLTGALLNNADLSGANLRDADLSGADLTNAEVTEQQLREAETLKGATMPSGQKYEEWLKSKERGEDG